MTTPPHTSLSSLFLPEQGHTPQVSSSSPSSSSSWLNPNQQQQQPLLGGPGAAKPSLYSTRRSRSTEAAADQPLHHADHADHADHEEEQEDHADTPHGHREEMQHHRVHKGGSQQQLVPMIPSLSLYAVHALCTFDERIYEFASYFFIMEIFKTTLLPMSIYGFSTTVAGILFSTTVGSLVDTTPRLTAVQSFLFTQKFTTVLGALGFWVLLTWFDPSSQDHHSPISSSTPTTSQLESIPSGEQRGTLSLSLYQGYCLFAFLVLASGVLKLSALGWSISIERDWIVALCQSESDLLTKLNVNMKRIDLGCKLISPLIFAALLTLFDNNNAAGYCSLIMAIWCMGSFCMELVLVRRIWYNSPVLWQARSLQSRSDHVSWKQTRAKDTDIDRERRSDSEDGAEEQDLFVTRVTKSKTSTRVTKSRAGTNAGRDHPRSLLERGLGSFQEYAHHIVLLASLSYAIIYINMMSVSGTMIGYLQWRGFTAGSIALLKGICTVSELLGTILMPVLTHYVGLVRAGAWSIWLEVATLTPVLLSIYSDKLPVQVMIFAGMALSRVGVWSFDLVITQILQEYISPDLDYHNNNSVNDNSIVNNSNNNAGVINGWHYSMMNLFELGQFILTMIWSDPRQYFIPCTLSYVCVVLGAVVYSAHLIRMRGHLFHYQRIASAASSYLVREDEAMEYEEDGEQAGESEVDHDQPGPSRRNVHRQQQHREDQDDDDFI